MVEMIAFVCYLVLVLGIGVFFFMKSRKSNGGDKDYFLGGRQMNGWVAALSAGASDMSAWVLMGLPGSIYALGMGQVWISVGLFLGTVAAWIFVAPRLRRLSIKSGDAITIPQYLTKRFKSSNPVLQIICAIIFIVAYCVYAASSIVACGTLFNTVFGDLAPASWDVKTIAMVGATIIILVYTFLGGFNDVCWTDFFQGMLMLLALMTAPIVAVFVMNGGNFKPVAEVVTGENYYNLLSSGSFNWKSIADILSGLGWGLGYFGMPHILIRYMSIRSEKEMKKSRVIGSIWTGLILAMATVVGLVGHKYLGGLLMDGGDTSTVFIHMVRGLFPALISGILLSAILAASMSTADSQLLTSSSAFASDVYKPVFRKNASNKEMLWAGRIVVALIAVVALLIALNPKCGGIMDLVGNAWGMFGAAFGPAILLSLYWKRFNFAGAVSGIATGFVVDIVWLYVLPSTGLYEIIPGFLANLVVAVVVTLLTKAPAKEVADLVDEGTKEIEE